MTTLLLVDSTVPVILLSSEMYDITYLGNPLASVSERGVQDTSTDSLPLRVIATLDRGEVGAKSDKENTKKSISNHRITQVFQSQQKFNFCNLHLIPVCNKHPLLTSFHCE